MTSNYIISIIIVIIRSFQLFLIISNNQEYKILISSCFKLFLDNNPKEWVATLSAEETATIETYIWLTLKVNKGRQVYFFLVDDK